MHHDISHVPLSSVVSARHKPEYLGTVHSRHVRMHHYYACECTLEFIFPYTSSCFNVIISNISSLPTRIAEACSEMHINLEMSWGPEQGKETRKGRRKTTWGLEKIICHDALRSERAFCVKQRWALRAPIQEAHYGHQDVVH